MGLVDLSELSGNDFVFHFGGRTNEINAFTFAQSTLAFSKALKEINYQLTPNFDLMISIEALGPGSFRALFRTGSKDTQHVLTGCVREILIGLLVCFIFEKLNPSQTNIIVTDGSYVVERGNDRIVLPKSVIEAKKSLQNPQAVQKHISMAFTALDQDDAITEFGITKDLADKKPFLSFPREEFGKLSEEVIEVPAEKERFIQQPAQLVVLKAILERSDRKWQFVWDGFKISAPIKDKTFFDRLARREFEFGQGDILDGVLGIYQVFDDVSGVYINQKYEIVLVNRRRPGPKQMDLPLENVAALKK